MIKPVLISLSLIAASGAAGLGLSSLHGSVMSDVDVFDAAVVVQPTTPRFQMPEFVPPQRSAAPVTLNAPVAPVPAVLDHAAPAPWLSAPEATNVPIIRSEPVARAPRVVVQPRVQTAPTATAPVLVAQSPLTVAPVFSTQGSLSPNQDYVIGVYR